MGLWSSQPAQDVRRRYSTHAASNVATRQRANLRPPRPILPLPHGECISAIQCNLTVSIQNTTIWQHWFSIKLTTLFLFWCYDCIDYPGNETAHTGPGKQRTHLLFICTNKCTHTHTHIYICIYIYIYIYIKCTLVQALRLCTGCTAHRGSRGIAVLYRH